HCLLPPATDARPRRDGTDPGCPGGAAGGLRPQAEFRPLGRTLFPPPRLARLGKPSARLRLILAHDRADSPPPTDPLHDALCGAAGRMFRVSRVMAGAAVPAGEHTLVYTYEPASFRIGAMVSTAGLIVLVALAWSARRGPRASATGNSS